ncbi:hypothetical protein [Crateriforma spongiae]|uniref:hypothetical protein n=1 Tax=Crateriforma spongiae TaxID=2724528 RepID=UPI001446BF70|nr:hypothetical protein [Crateriforma spongiae]
MTLKIDKNTVALLPMELNNGIPSRIGRTRRRIERGTLIEVRQDGNRLEVRILSERAIEETAGKSVGTTFDSAPPDSDGNSQCAGLP